MSTVWGHLLDSSRTTSLIRVFTPVTTLWLFPTTSRNTLSHLSNSGDPDSPVPLPYSCLSDLSRCRRPLLTGRLRQLKRSWTRLGRPSFDPPIYGVRERGRNKNRRRPRRTTCLHRPSDTIKGSSSQRTRISSYHCPPPTQMSPSVLYRSCTHLKEKPGVLEDG